MKKAFVALLLVVALLCGSFSAVYAEEGEKVLHLYTDRVYRTFNQWMCSDGNVFEVMGSYSEGLFRLDENHNPQLALAESYTLSDDGLVYTFTLRDGLVWSNGTPLTAADFEFGWLKAIESVDYGYSSVLAAFIKNGMAYMNGECDASEVGIKALDEKTFEVTLANPTAFFDRLITLPVCFPLNEAFITEKGDQYALTADDILYCGPFVCTSLDVAVGATLVKNPTYWDAENVKLDGVEWKVITDSSAALNAFEAGEIDVVNLASADIIGYMSDPLFATRSDFRNYYLQFDVENEKMNLNIRKALSYAIDRETLAYGVLMTGAVPAGGVVSQGINGNGEQTFREVAGANSAYDPELAKEYWAKGVEELGYTPELTMLTATGTDFDDMAVYVQDQFRTVLGIEVAINAMTQKARNEVMNNETYDMALSAWGADYDDAMTWLELWTNDTGYRGNYAKPEYIELVNQAMAETDPAARLEIMVKAETMLIAEDMCVTGLYDRGYSYMLKDYVNGMFYHPVGQPVEVKYASIG